MRRTNSGLMYAAGAVAVFFVTSAQAGIIDGLVSHYTFDGTSGAVVDSTGFHNGTNYGAVRGVAGKIGNAFQFDGFDDYVDTLPPSEISGAITIGLWIHPTIDTGGHQIFGSIQNASGGKDGIFFAHNANTASLEAAYVESNIDRGDVLYSSTNSVLPNTWTHITHTVDDLGNASIYVNGSLDGSGSYSVPTTSHDRALMFGKSILSQNLAFDGLMDDVKIWDRALSAEEVAQVAGSTVPEPSTLAIWSLLGVAVGFGQWRKRRKR